MKKTAVIIAILGFFTGQALFAAEAEVGNKAPDFTLKNIHGEEVSLSDYSDKIVVLEWTNQGCPFVKKHYNAGNMQKLQKKYTEKGLAWLTICSSAEDKEGYMDNEEWQDTVDKIEIASTAVLPDPEGKVGKTYGATATPHMFVIDKSGTLVYAGAIDDKPSTNKKTVNNASNYVVEIADDLLAGKDIEPKSTKPYGCSVKY